LFAGLSEAGRSGARREPEQGEQRDRLFPSFPVAEASTIMTPARTNRGPYLRPMGAWWRRDPFFMRYMLRESTALAVAAVPNSS